MTVTNDERREVASKLRIANQHGFYSDREFVDTLRSIVGTNLNSDCTHLMTMYRLADLVEPEPERTCRNVARDKEAWFVCSECLWECSPPSMVTYCFNCGCKVEK